MEDVAPLLVFGNPTSGGGDAGTLLKMLEGVPKVYTVLLPSGADEWKYMSPEILDDPSLRVVAAGGDGTVNWVLSMLASRYPSTDDGILPPIAVYPCGTGNDLSRALGWGGKATITTKEELDEFLSLVRTSPIIQLDTWNITIKPTEGEVFGRRMLNYFSIGTDAKIACDFEDFRKAFPGIIQSQLLSKALYVPISMQSFLGVQSLHHYARVFVEEKDGTEIEVFGGHGEKTVVFQSITSIYGGQDLWHAEDPRTMDDGLFEVVTLGGVVSLGLEQIGLPVSRQIMQGSKALIITTDACHIQIDGEGKLVSSPSQIVLEHSGNYPMTYKPQK